MAALRDYLSTIADSIRSKDGSSEPINAQEFAQRIMNIPSGGGIDESKCVKIVEGEEIKKLVFGVNGNVSEAFKEQTRLAGSPVCGDSVTELSSSFLNCANLTGNPVCGSAVRYMSNAYNGCRKLTGSPVCGDSVVIFRGAYVGCTNLTGSPVCGANVTTFDDAYMDCPNLSGDFYCGEKIDSIRRTFRGCYALQGNHYYNNSVNITCAAYAYDGRNAASQRINLFIPHSINSFFNVTSYSSIFGQNVTWTDITDENGIGYYNAAFNTYIYPIAGI